jgi:hypothetical protein
MDLLRKYLLSTAMLRTADEGGAPEPAGDPPPAPAAEIVDLPAADGDDAGDVDPAPPAADAGDHGNKGKKPWFLDRISAETEARRAAEQRASDAEAMLQRLQNGNRNPTDPPASPSPPPQDFNAAVRNEATRLRLSEDSTAIRDAGLKEYGTSFGESLAILTAVGATADDIVLDLIAVDKANAHKILSTLAKDPERAAAIAGMDSRRRTAELTRMSMAAAATTNEPAPAPAARPAPGKQVSRAPAPPPPVEPSASKVIDWRSDEASDEEFDRGFKETMAKRSARR